MAASLRLAIAASPMTPPAGGGTLDRPHPGPIYLSGGISTWCKPGLAGIALFPSEGSPHRLTLTRGHQHALE